MFDLPDPSKKIYLEPKEAALTNLEAKVVLCLEKMQESLEQKQEPNFTQFWQAKKECVLLFKEKLPAQKRNQLWQRYLKLSNEGRVVRDFLDEEALFAIEQIELAIQDIERQYRLLEESKCAMQREFSPSPQALSKIYDSCCQLQNLIHQAQLLTIRLQELRKEVSVMSIRMKIKGKFFDRLSFVCDQLFPKRNQMIAQLSEQFFQAVTEFVTQNFSKNNPYHLKRSCYHLQNEIREIQAIAKQFSLSTQVFMETRKELSRCWDLLKEVEKEKKEDFSQLKDQSDQNAQIIEKMIEELSSEASNLSEKEVIEKLRGIQKEMKNLPLLKKQMAVLEKKCELLRKPFDAVREKIKEEQREKKKQEQFVEEQNVKNFLDQLVVLQQTLNSQAVEESRFILNDLQEKLGQLSCAQARKKVLKERLKEVGGAFTLLEEKILLSDVSVSKEHQTKLSAVLEEKITQRDKVKSFLEDCRKERGKSGLNFAQALELNEKIEKGKAELQVLEQSILDFDHKIDSFN